MANLKLRGEFVFAAVKLNLPLLNLPWWVFCSEFEFAVAEFQLASANLNLQL